MRMIKKIGKMMHMVKDAPGYNDKNDDNEET